MEQINNNALNSYMADYQYRTEQNKKTETAEKTDKTEKKTKVSGRTIGEPELSEKAAKYYEKLKKKYSNMDFVLVSPEKKAEAERNKGMYQSSKDLLVLIDSDKIEKMAEDEEYRKKYENILNGATAQIAQMKNNLASKGESVRSVGLSFDDHGNASFFAVIDKSLAAQRERIAEKKAETAKKQKADQKKEAERAAEEKRKEKAKANGNEKGEPEMAANRSDLVTVTASSWDDLMRKIDGVLFDERADHVMTAEEKAVGGSFDYSI